MEKGAPINFFFFFLKRTVELVVPASMRRFIIGPKGSTLSQIEAKSYTRINFPRKDEEDATKLDDEDMVVLTIMGESSGIKIAKEEIEKIVGDKVKLNVSVTAWLFICEKKIIFCRLVNKPSR